MEYRQLGRAGARVSIIGLGTNRFGTDQLPQEEVNKIIDAALDLGINFIDAANTYVHGRCEETLGHALKGHRERFILATKAALPIGDGLRPVTIEAMRSIPAMHRTGPAV